MKRKGSEIPKPYTAYTIFWRLERMYILHEAGCIDEIKACFDPNHYDPLEHPRPEKYANLILPPYWYSSAHRYEHEKKRKHRKQDRSIDKNDLTAMIAKSWREVDPIVRNYVSKLAMAEKEKYTAPRESGTQSKSKSQPQLASSPVISSKSIVPVILGPLRDADLSLFDSSTLEDDDFQFNFSNGDF